MTARKRILVTGAGGFLGSAILSGLSAREDLEVTGIISPRQQVPQTARLTPVDILDESTLNAAVEDARPEIIVNAAGRAHLASDSATSELFAVNISGTRRVIEAGGRIGASKVIHLSSIQVYGAGGESPKTEESVTGPIGAYAQSKLEGEIAAIDAARKHPDLNLVIFRVAMVPSSKNYSNLSDLAHAISRRRFIWVGRGRNLKSLVALDDVVKAVERQVDSTDEAGIEIFNVAGCNLRMSEIVESLAAGLDAPVPGFRIPEAVARVIARLAGGRFGIPTADRLNKFTSNDAVSNAKLLRLHPDLFQSELSEILRLYGRSFRA